MKIISLCKTFMLIALLGSGYAAAIAQEWEEKELWSGEHTLTGWGESVLYRKCELTDVAANDVLRFAFSATGANAQIQIAVDDSDNSFDKNNCSYLMSYGGADYADVNSSSFEYTVPASMARVLNAGQYLIVDGHDLTVTGITLFHDKSYVAPDPDDPSVYKQGTHIFDRSEPMFSGTHDFASDWSGKLVFHPSAFPEFDEEHTYRVQVSGSGAVQVGLGYWENGEEIDFSGLSEGSSSPEITLSASVRRRIADGWCLQLNASGGSVSRVELIIGEKGYEPDFSAKSFYVRGTQLYDAFDNEFVMRGVNYSWAWQGNEGTINEAAASGFNTVRIQLGSGNKWSYGSASALEGLISRCESAGIVCMFNVQDYTDSSDPADLRKAVDYWCSPDIIAVMNEHKGSTILNINNEWPAATDQELWRDGYLEAIPRLRQAGYGGLLVVDCGGWGQDGECYKYARQVFDSDVLGNTMFSIHMYQCAGHPSYYKRNLDNFRNQNLPIMIGEIAFEHKSSDYDSYPDGGPVAWREILEYCYLNNVGWIAWSWTGNGGGAESCDIYGNGGIQENGKCLMYGRYGMKETSAKCQVFSESPRKESAYIYPVDQAAFSVDNPECEYPYPGRDYADDDRDSYVFNHNVPYTVENSMNDFWIKSDMFNYAREGDYLEIIFSDLKPGHRIKIGYFEYFGSVEWKTVHEGDNPDGNVINIPLFRESGRRASQVDYVDDNSGMIHHLRNTGMHVRGEGFTVQASGIKNRDGNVITSTGDIESPGADDAPAEIYTVTGQRVSEMQPGNVYIVKKGSDVRKIIR